MPVLPALSVGGPHVHWPLAVAAPRAVHQRLNMPNAPSPAIVRFGPFTLDEGNALLLHEGQAIELVPKAFGVLCHLASRPGQLVTKDELLDAVWGRRFVSESVLKSAVKTIRAQLGDDAQAPRYVETVNRRGYRFIGAARPQASQVAPTLPVPLPPLIGRADALQALAAQWVLTTSGQRRLVLVAGEPGIGKSTLVDHFVDHATVDGEPAWIGRGQCVEQVGASTAYLPVLEALSGLCGQDAALATLMRHVAPTWLVQLPWLVTADDRAALHREVAGAGPDRMLRELGELLARASQHRPMLLFLEDLHWSDPVTIQLLDLLARRRGPARVMIVATFRPTEITLSGHPLADLRRELKLHGLCEELTLEGLARAEVEALMLQRLSGERCDPALVTALLAHTEGLPLFVVRVLDELLTEGALVHEAGVWSSRAALGGELPLPPQLAEVIERQLARLEPDLCALLEAASLCPANFEAAVLAGALDAEPAAVARSLADLARKRLWLRPAPAAAHDSVTGAERFGFGHALFRQVLRGRIDAQRRVALHRRLGAALEQTCADRLPEVAAELGLHGERGQQPERAAAFLALAAQASMQRFSPRHALSLAQRGQQLLRQLPHAPDASTQASLAALTLLALVATRGYVAEPTVAAAREAMGGVIDAPLAAQALPLWHGCWWIETYAGHGGHAADIAERLLGHADAARQTPARAVALTMRGVMACHANRFGDAEADLGAALDAMRGLPDSFDRGFFPHAPRIEALAHRLHAQALQGHFSAAALTRAELERHLASGRHPLSESQGLWCLAYVHQQRGECESAAVLCERALARMSGHDANPGKPLHLALLACTCASLGALERGATLAREAIQRHSEQRTRMAQVVIHTLAGAALLRAGELREARELIDAALRLSADPGNCFGLADALGLLGELQWREARDGPLAESTLRRAIGVAREQRAVLLEVHACDRLAALWDALDRTADACALMREVLARLDAQADAPQLGAVRERQAVRYSASAT